MRYICTNPIFPLLQIYFTPIKEEHGPLCILAIPVTVVQPDLSTVGWPKQGSEVTERGEGVGGGFSPSHGREIF